MHAIFLKKSRLLFLSATIIGGALEWYELYLFIHWNSVLSKLFFQDNPLLSTYNTLFIFFVGVLGRPVGALLFGTMGDRLGRKVAFTYSISLMVLPSLLIGTMGWILPFTGIAAAIVLSVLRFIQGMAVGAELPGAMCYLAECASKSNRAFICSFSFVGPHVGILMSQCESLIFELYFSQHFIETYGWRFSFIFGGLLALWAVIYRHKLHESPQFTELKEAKHLSKNPILDAISKHKNKLFTCFFALLVSVVVFFIYTVFLEVYLQNFIATSRINVLLLGMFITATQVFMLPLWGKLGDKYPIQKMLILSTFGFLFFSLSLFLSNNLFIIGLIALFILICLNVQSALMPCYIAELFPTAIRYTGIALSFTLCDSLIGGAVPWFGGFLAKEIGIKPTFVLFTFISGLISLYVFMKSNKLSASR